jgi:D-alanyl-D-alanine endopeptidase (penicillin-binding protein 7)
MLALIMISPAYAKKSKHHSKHHSTAVHSAPRTIHSVSTLAYDMNAGVTIQGRGVGIVRPMASLTKLMTAMVSLDHDRSLSSRIAGQSREELFKALLVRSNNEVAELLSRNYPGGRPAFISAMNVKAHELGMLNTHFDDPSGRIVTNVSTAEDVGRMLMAASQYPEIRRISTYKHLERTHTIKRRHKTQVVHNIQNNTNVMVLQAFPDVIVSKTGFTNPAGYCVGVVVEQGTNRYLVVVMGARNKFDRFDHVRDIMHNNIMTNGHQRQHAQQFTKLAVIDE